jgi:hypothetical protein
LDSSRRSSRQDRRDRRRSAVQVVNCQPRCQTRHRCQHSGTPEWGYRPCRQHPSRHRFQLRSLSDPQSQPCQYRGSSSRSFLPLGQLAVRMLFVSRRRPWSPTGRPRPRRQRRTRYTHLGLFLPRRSSGRRKPVSNRSILRLFHHTAYDRSRVT